MMKRILPIMLAICLLLCACASQADPAESTVETTAAPVAEATTAAAEQTTVPVEETTEATTAPTEVTLPEVELGLRNPLNGQPLDEE